MSWRIRYPSRSVAVFRRMAAYIFMDCAALLDHFVCMCYRTGFLTKQTSSEAKVQANHFELDN